MRAYDLLADPKPCRFSGYRAAQMRNVAAELRRVCAHPTLLDAAAGGDDGEADWAAAAMVSLNLCSCCMGLGGRERGAGGEE